MYRRKRDKVYRVVGYGHSARVALTPREAWTAWWATWPHRLTDPGATSAHAVLIEADTEDAALSADVSVISGAGWERVTDDAPPQSLEWTDLSGHGVIVVTGRPDLDGTGILRVRDGAVSVLWDDGGETRIAATVRDEILRRSPGGLADRTAHLHRAQRHDVRYLEANQPH